MPFYKKILVLLILLLFSYILFQLLKKRQEIQKLSSKEGFTTKIQPVNSANTQMPLSQYCIKASYNTALSGKTISMDAVNAIIANGCRFLDFEVFLIDGIPYVAYSTDSSFKTVQTENKILLDNVLTGVLSRAFVDIYCPNPSDPLFIQLRIKSTDNSIYKAVAKSVDYALKEKLHKTPITPATKLAEIMNKVVLVMDKTIQYDYLNYTTCGSNDKNCYDLSKYINIESGSEYMKIQRYGDVLNKKINPPTINDDNETTSVSNIQLVLPDFDAANIKNPNINTLVSKYGCQIVPYRYYNADNELSNYETFFSDNKSAILPLSKALMYFTKLESDQ